MKTCYQLADELGLTKDELLPHGHHIAKVDYQQVLNRLKDRPDGKFIEVIELPKHPWFLAVQFHPEFQSKPLRPHPLFADFVRASHQHAKAGAETTESVVR